MVIGRLSFGRRMYGKRKFRFFYCPLLKENRKEQFRFFWWIGKHWYVALHKKPKDENAFPHISNDRKFEDETISKVKGDKDAT